MGKHPTLRQPTVIPLITNLENKKFVKEFQNAFGNYPKVGALYGYIAATFIAKAYEKAGKTDTEKFIDALEGMSVDSPVAN